MKESEAVPRALKVFVRCVLLFVSCSLIAPPTARAVTPKVGWKKVVVRSAPPSKQKPPQITQGTAAEIVQEYAESTALYVSEDEIPEIVHRGTEMNLEIVVRDDFDVLQLPNGHIDTRKGTAGSLPGRRLGPPANAGTPGLYLLQFAGPIMNAWTDHITAAGVTFIQYVPMNSYIVASRPEVMAEVSRLSFVQFVDVFHATLKTQSVPRTKGANTEMLISVANIADTGKTLRNLERLSLTELTTEVIGENREELRVRGTFDGADVDAIVDERLVFGVSRVPRLGLSDERAAMSLGPYADSQGNVLTVGGRYKSWLEGICPACAMLKQAGFYTGVADTGFWVGPKNASGNNDAGPAELPNDHAGSAGRVVYGTDYSESTTGPNPQPVTGANATATAFDDEPQGSVGASHGTFVTSVLAGNPTSGADSAGFLYGMGVAPSAGVKITKLKFTTTNTTGVFELAHDARAATSPVAYIQNHSLNEYAGPNSQCENPDGRYAVVSKDFDRAVRDSNGNPADGSTPILLVVSAGNQHQSLANENCPNETVPPIPLTAPPGTAKNVLAIGATETPRTSSENWNCRSTNTGSDGLQNVEVDSKRGTVDAGYYKPDLMAPAANVAALKDDSTTQMGNCGSYNLNSVLPPSAYAGGTGTSFAAPIGSGAALLASRVYSSNPGDASPALLKTMLIMSARSMMGGKDYADREKFALPGKSKNPVTTIGAIPSQSQGFGRMHLERILDPYPARSYVNQETLPAAGSSWTNMYTVHDGTRPVIIVLAWTDIPAQVNEGQFLTTPIVNDLDLTVFRGASCVERFLGNNLSSSTEESLGVACTGGGPFPFDRKNNVEYVRFSGSNAGSSFTVTVTFQTADATQGGGAQGSNQNFALAVWNAHDADDAAPPAAPTGVAANATSSTSIDVSWNAVSGATGYDVRMWDGGAFWKTIVTNQAGTTYTQSGVTPLSSYLFDVRARNGTGVSPPSAPDGATTFPNGSGALFTDDPIVPGTTVVKAVHVNELRAAVNAFRASAGLGAMTFTDPTPTIGTTPIKRAHVHELRNALDAARVALTLSALTYADSDLTGKIVESVHLQELRNAVK